MTSKRTAKDEADYNEELRREEPIKTEVITELKQQNKTLWEGQANLLEALILAQDALRVYRMQTLAHARRMMEHRGDCVAGCTKHVWHDSDGWHRKDPA